ncbi:DUF2953 domain-containing protein [Ruminococcus sp.]|uniref:DUF2953 domain-containing protein n=1 Tax=Ruminococcus sp. TaxID=41978 RepID=UPI0038698573
MVFLYIILGILLLIFLISLIRVQVFALYSEDLTLSLKILFFKIKLLPQDEEKKEKKEKKPKKEKKKKKKKKEEEKPEKEKKEEKKPSLLAQLKDKHGVTGLIELFRSAANIATGMLKGIISHVVFEKLDVGIMLSGNDAASVAVTYGKVCAALYPSINILTSATVCRDYNISIEPVFDPEKPTEVYANIHVYLRIIFVLGAAIKAGFRFLILFLKAKFKK